MVHIWEPAFAPTLDAVLEHDRLWLDVGPGCSLSTLARLHPKVRAGASTVVSFLPTATSARDGLDGEIDTRVISARSKNSRVDLDPDPITCRMSGNQRRYLERDSDECVRETVEARSLKLRRDARHPARSQRR